MLFKGSGVALVTPFANNQIDFNKLESLIEWHLQEKTDAIIVCGTTGEAATLSVDEKKAVIDFTVKKVNKRIPVIAGTGSNCTTATIELSLSAQSLGVDGLLIVTPYYNKPTQTGLYQHFTAVANQVTIPIIIYNIPSRTGVNIYPETVFKLSKHPKIVGIKEASGDISQIAEIAQMCAQDFAIYSGNDDHIVPVLALGGVGVISVLANILPKDTHLLVTNYLEGKVEAAAFQQKKLIKLIKALFIETNPIPIKTAMNIMGMNVGMNRLPLTEMSVNNKEILKKAMKDLGLFFDD